MKFYCEFHVAATTCSPYNLRSWNFPPSLFSIVFRQTSAHWLWQYGASILFMDQILLFELYKIIFRDSRPVIPFPSFRCLLPKLFFPTYAKKTQPNNRDVQQTQFNHVPPFLQFCYNNMPAFLQIHRFTQDIEDISTQISLIFFPSAATRL